jgi:hypothetical protein
VILRVPIRGRGRAQLPAYGLTDAEHRVEKEITQLWPEAVVQVLEVGRGGDDPRIVEEFTISYRIDGALDVDAPSPEEARRAAFREARRKLADSRYHRTEWESPERP